MQEGEEEGEGCCREKKGQVLKQEQNSLLGPGNYTLVQNMIKDS